MNRVGQQRHRKEKEKEEVVFANITMYECMASGLHRGVSEIFVLLGFYAPSISS
jgi:hypothetical protein